MAIRLPLLVALAALLLFTRTEAGAARNSCLQCHRPHYQAKGSCVSCHKGDPRSDRLRIAHHDLVPARFSWYGIPDSPPLERGNRLLETFACRRCHATGGKGNRSASNLDRLPAGTTPGNLFDSIREPALLMPEFRFDDRQITDLVNALEAGGKEAGREGGKASAEPPQVVHFQGKEEDRDNVFVKQCGSCHRLLTRNLGGLGSGGIGPNLSGLLSEHYPRTAPGNASWRADSLEKWLKNPRQAREQTTMRPVKLQREELARLVAVLADAPVPVRLAAAPLAPL